MRFILAAWIAGCGADAVSTCYDLNAGLRETILTQSCSVNAAIISGEAVVGVVSLGKLHKTHPKWAVLIGVAAASFRFGVAARNVRLANGVR